MSNLKPLLVYQIKNSILVLIELNFLQAALIQQHPNKLMIWIRK